MVVTCPCGATVPEAYVCSTCAAQLGEDLRRLAELTPELDNALARQTRYGDTIHVRISGRLHPLPVDGRVSAVMAEVHNTLGTWVRVLTDENLPGGLSGGVPLGRSESHGGGLSPLPRSPRANRTITTAQTAMWLSGHLELLRHHEAAAEALADLTRAAKRVERIVDRPPDRWYAGPCEECRGDLYASDGAAMVTCSCGTHYDVGARRRWLLSEVQDSLATSAEAAALVGISQASIRGYVHRRRLTDHGRNRSGLLLYRLGDILDLVAERQRAEAS